MKSCIVKTSGFLSRDKKWAAIRKMTGSELAVYLYMVDNSNSCHGDSFPIEVQHVADVTGIGKASCFRALNGLTQKRFIAREKGKIIFDALGNL